MGATTAVGVSLTGPIGQGVVQATVENAAVLTPALATVLTGLGTNWLSTVGIAGWSRACLRLARDPEWDLRDALNRALARAAEDLEDEWGKTAASQRLRGDPRGGAARSEQERGLFQSLREGVGTLTTPDDLNRMLESRDQLDLLRGDEATIREAIVERLGRGLGVPRGDDLEPVVRFIGDNLPTALAKHLGNELRASGPVGEGARGAFDRMLREELLAGLDEARERALREGQDRQAVVTAVGLLQERLAADGTALEVRLTDVVKLAEENLRQTIERRSDELLRVAQEILDRQSVLDSLQAGQQQILARLGATSGWLRPPPRRPSQELLHGRDRELDDLEWHLGPGRTVAVSGMAGAGKSLLAEHLARRLDAAFPGGVLHQSLGADFRRPEQAAPILAEWGALAFGMRRPKGSSSGRTWCGRCWPATVGCSSCWMTSGRPWRSAPCCTRCRPMRAFWSRRATSDWRGRCAARRTHWICCRPMTRWRCCGGWTHGRRTTTCRCWATWRTRSGATRWRW